MLTHFLLVFSTLFIFSLHAMEEKEVEINIAGACDILRLNKAFPWHDPELSDFKKLDLSNKKIKSLSSYLIQNAKFKCVIWAGPTEPGDALKAGLLQHTKFYDQLKAHLKEKNIRFEEFDLSHNQMTLLPKSFWPRFTSLRSLNVSHNKLRKLPSSIGKLENLEELYLSHNDDLDTLPDNMTQLTKLKTLHLGVYFDGCHGTMPTDVHCCALTSLPVGIEELPNLDTESRRNLLTLKRKFARHQQYRSIKNNPVWLNIYRSLTKEEKNSLSAANYIKNPDAGRETIKLTTKRIFEILNPEGLDEHECAKYLISLREQVLCPSKPIKVVDPETARARAAQRLTHEEIFALGSQEYSENNERSKKAIETFAQYVTEEFKKNKFLPIHLSEEEFKQQCITDKIAELNKAYA